MNLNQKAIEYYERNAYGKAMDLFHEALNQYRDVQALNNLAWMYLYEEEDVDQAFELIQEAVALNPASRFPYNILGEIHIKRENWKEAKEALEKSISIQPSSEARINLAAVYYQLGEMEPAAKYYLQSSEDPDISEEDADLSMYCYIKCLIDLGKFQDAKEALDCFFRNKKSESSIGEIEIADLYIEINNYNGAIYWFEKGCNDSLSSPYWISRFAYALYKMNRLSRLDEVIKEAIATTNKRIEEVLQEETDEYWTENDRKELIETCREEIDYYGQLKEKLVSGYIPKFLFAAYFTGGCYLFGCKQHGHPEYKKI
ncbi:MAG: tetratricopeptide repeat protein [Bacilli bacterium]|uniref:Tetratricopeptide repeat protein n=1 Tax=Ureibacillus suwonensis TaxID=313007 RepID=A0ABW0RET0_9BACL|nr:hypothetical protein [Bacilli bacterium]